MNECDGNAVTNKKSISGDRSSSDYNDLVAHNDLKTNLIRGVVDVWTCLHL